MQSSQLSKHGGRGSETRCRKGCFVSRNDACAADCGCCVATAQASHPPKRQVLCSWSTEVLFLKRMCEQSAGLKAREHNGARVTNLVHTSWAEICCSEEQMAACHAEHTCSFCTVAIPS